MSSAFNLIIKPCCTVMFFTLNIYGILKEMGSRRLKLELNPLIPCRYNTVLLLYISSNVGNTVKVKNMNNYFKH